MRETARKLGYALVALFGAIALTFTTAIAWAATTVLVVPGTGTKDPSKVPGYQENVVGYYVAPTGACDDGGCTATPVPYIAEFWPIPLEGWGGLEGAKWDDSVASGVISLNEQYAAADKSDPIVIFGYSQGGTVVTEVKKQLAENGGVPDNVSFVLIGNASRPNGGLFTRPSFLGHVPFLDVTFGPGTPTNTGTEGRPVNTTDVAFQYDGVTDFPRYPANLLATANAIAGFWYVHGKMLSPKGDDPATQTPIGYTPDEVQAAVEAATDNCTTATHCQISGDTRYVTLPAKILPIMLPLLELGAATNTTALVRPFVDLTSPLARVIIETGYDRTDYGKATPFGLFPSIDPLRLGVDLVGATVQGIGAAATGTGDASRYLAPEPSTDTPSTDTPSTDIPDTDAPSTPKPEEAVPTSQKTAPPVLQLVQGSTSEAPAVPTQTVTTEPSNTTEASASQEPSNSPEPSNDVEPSNSTEPQAPSQPEATSENTSPAPTADATAPETTSGPTTDDTSDEPVVTDAAA
ncbi:PE-PPE domain-containing protein [Tsukamurella sp. PLM1]|uniref:PE-PPE domain-containing protein n=1 Tax=Tsukamurella sp. PLM1 TaxID=2929795 RepID=UPI0020502825|nr:PE-PPE domain-containing protein [Tsukamurella sp. PLM1]BDH59597.1 PE-PPE domain-containing protein [Tsukamurella sp. PLM1]